MPDSQQSESIPLGVLDSGVEVGPGIRVADQAAFAPRAEGTVARCILDTGGLDHGTAVARTILDRAPGVALLSAQVFRYGRPDIPTVVAAGLDWLVESGARIVNMSFGLRDDRKVLRAACSRALDRGALLVASAPARGPVVYPAAYPGVIRVTGDARCAPGELSWLGNERADFGACVGGPGHRPHDKGVGASLAAAHFSGELARVLSQAGGNREALGLLRQSCCHIGAERRGV